MSQYFYKSWFPLLFLSLYPVSSGVMSINSGGGSNEKCWHTLWVKTSMRTVNDVMAFGLCPPENVQDSEVAKGLGALTFPMTRNMVLSSANK